MRRRAFLKSMAAAVVVTTTPIVLTRSKDVTLEGVRIKPFYTNHQWRGMQTRLYELAERVPDHWHYPKQRDIALTSTNNSLAGHSLGNTNNPLHPYIQKYGYYEMDWQQQRSPEVIEYITLERLLACVCVLPTAETISTKRLIESHGLVGIRKRIDG